MESFPIEESKNEETELRQSKNKSKSTRRLIMIFALALLHLFLINGISPPDVRVCSSPPHCSASTFRVSHVRK